MTQRVVDRFETIEIDEQHRERRRFALAAADRPRELLGEQAAIRQAGELVVLRKLLQFVGPARDIGDVAERDDAADQVTLAVIETLAVDRQDRIRLFGHPEDRNLVGELLAAARPDERQIRRVFVIVAVLVDAAESLLPGRVRLRTRAEGENRARGRVDVENMAMAVDDDDAIVDVPEYRQDRDIGLREPLLKAMSFDRVLERRLLAFDGYVVDADVPLGPCLHRGNAAVFVVFRRQRDHGMLVERSDQLGNGRSGLGDVRPGLDQNQVDDRRRVDGNLQSRRPGQQGAVGKRLEFTQILGSKFTAAKIEN